MKKGSMAKWIILGFVVSSCDFKQGSSSQSNVSQREYEQCVGRYSDKIHRMVKANLAYRILYSEPDPTNKLLSILPSKCRARQSLDDLTSYERGDVLQFFMDLDKY